MQKKTWTIDWISTFLVTKNILTITTTDLDQTIISSIEIDDEQDGKVAIPMVKLVDIITALQDEKIKITSTERIHIISISLSGKYPNFA